MSVNLEKVAKYKVQLKTTKVQSVSIVCNTPVHTVTVVDSLGQPVVEFKWEGAAYHLARVTGPLATFMIACGYDHAWASRIRASFAGWDTELPDLAALEHWNPKKD